MKYDFDAIVIGAGSGGLTASIGLSGVGKKVLLIERDRMGGECTNTGCIPSKSLIHLTRAYEEAKQLAGETDKLKDFKSKILDRVRRKVKEIRDEESPEVLEKKHGVKVVLGEASFKDAHTIQVQQKNETQTFSAKTIVLATGSSARVLPIEGLEPKRLLTNENLFDLEKPPRRLLVMGGGPIGTEMAQSFSRMGSKVTIVTNTGHILPREEKEVALVAQEQCEQMGITVIPNAQIAKCEGRFAIVEQQLKKGNKKTVLRHKVEFDSLLQGIGRVPNLKSLNLEAVGIKHTERLIVVDKHYRTSCKNVFAIGDVSSRAKFTHTAEDQGRHVFKKVLFPLYRPPASKPIPRVTYLEDEVASVGLSYDQACKHYDPQELVKISVPYASSDRAKTDEIREGLAVVVAKRITGKILGASMVGRNAGELLSVFTLAIQNNISLYKLNAMIVPYPVLGQIYKKLSDGFLRETFFNIKRDALYFLKKQIPKLLALAFWGVLLYSFYRYKTMNNLTSLDLAKEVYTFVTGTTYGPLAYIIIYALRPLIFFPATLLTLISGALFGFWGGVFYTIIGENMSANLAYWIGRFFGKDLFKGGEAEGAGLIASWQKQLEENSFVSVLIMRFIYLPFDLTNYACGLLKVNWGAYALATLIGIMPGLMTFVSFGATIENIQAFDLKEISFNPLQLVVSLLLFVSSLILARAIRRYQQRQQALPAQAAR